MARYKYSCSNCLDEVEFNFTIQKYLELKKSDHFKKIKCNKCDNVCEFTQTFGILSSKIKKDKETIVAEVKEEARKFADKVRAGDSRAIRNIYGEE